MDSSDGVSHVTLVKEFVFILLTSLFVFVLSLINRGVEMHFLRPWLLEIFALHNQDRH